MVAPIKFKTNAAAGPLDLSPGQRHALLAQHGMAMGWLLLTRAELNAMRQTMQQCQQENERLNTEQARMIAERVTPSETKEALETAQADLVRANDEIESWRQWTRFCLGDAGLEGNAPTKLIRENVVAAWDRLIQQIAAIRQHAERAAQLLEEEARCLRESHTVDGQWAGGEEQAKTAYDELMGPAAGLRANLPPAPAGLGADQKQS